MKLAYKRKRKEAEETGDEDFLAKVMQCIERLSDCVILLARLISFVVVH